MAPRIVSILRQAFLPSDEQAMLSVRRQADPAAFALLMRRWQQPIERLCRRMTGDAHLAEDLTQEVFSRLYARRLTYRGEGRFSNYIRRIAVNVCTDRHRRRRLDELTGLDVGDEPDGGPASAPAERSDDPAVLAGRQERIDRVREALQRLSEVQRVVLVLRHYEGLTFRQIAEVLSVPEGTVKSRMAEALNRLARMLQSIRKEDSCPTPETCSPPA